MVKKKAERKQFLIKLGYATTVNKAQGRTILSLIIDCYNFWKPAQLGVAIGRCTKSSGLQVDNFNLISATIKHPDVVHEFNSKIGKAMRQDKQCCQTNIVRATAVRHNAFAFNVAANAPNFGAEDTCNTSQLDDFPAFDSETELPFHYVSFIDELKLEEFTEIQRRRNEVLQSMCDRESVKTFILDAYSMLESLKVLKVSKIPAKRNKCNWCIMCAHLQEYFEGTMYRRKCLTALDLLDLTSNQKRICCQIHFALGKIV